MLPDCLLREMSLLRACFPVLGVFVSPSPNCQRAFSACRNPPARAQAISQASTLGLRIITVVVVVVK
jgi:hypothetical protein